jgi:tRNA (cmo5U34)-methyltransferase
MRSGNSAVVGLTRGVKPLRPVILRPMAFAAGSLFQNLDRQRNSAAFIGISSEYDKCLEFGNVFVLAITAKIQLCFNRKFPNSTMHTDVPPENTDDHKKRDTLFAQRQDMIVDFQFDEKVASVFSDMIRRSVPGYGTLITLIGLLAEQYVQAGTTVYDLGCSLGATTISIHHRVRNTACRIYSVDNSEAMVQHCKDNLPSEMGNASIEVMCKDILDVEILNASLVVINLTLQFVDPALRLKLLRGIYNGLRPGGALIISEKLRFDNADEHAFQDKLHIAFKKANAYSDLEVSQKRSALEKVLIPDSFQSHKERLSKAGFAQVFQWFQCFNFTSFIAVK